MPLHSSQYLFITVVTLILISTDIQTSKFANLKFGLSKKHIKFEKIFLSFVKDKHTYGEKMARKGRTKVIYKGTFISKQSIVIKRFFLFLLPTFLMFHNGTNGYYLVPPTIFD